MTTTAPPKYMIHTISDSAASSDLPAATFEQALVRAAIQRVEIQAHRRSGCVIITQGPRILRAWICRALSPGRLSTACIDMQGEESDGSEK